MFQVTRWAMAEQRGSLGLLESVVWHLPAHAAASQEETAQARGRKPSLLASATNGPRTKLCRSDGELKTERNTKAWNGVRVR